MKNNQLKAGVILSYAIIVINCIVNILITPFLINNIGNSEYGLYQLIGAFVGYLTILDFGLGNAVIRYIAEYRQKGDKKKESNFLATTCLLYAVICVLIVLISIVLYFNLDSVFGKTLTSMELQEAKIMFIILVINLVVTIPGGMFNSIINGYEKYIFPRILSIVKTLVRVAVLYFLVTMGFKAIAIVVLDTVLNFAIIFINYIICKRHIHIKIKLYSFDKKMLKEIFNYSFFIFLNVIFNQINWKVDQTIIGMKISTAAVTLYVVGNNFSTVFQQFSTAISGVFLPKVTQMVVNGESKKSLTDFMIKVGRIQAMIIIYIYLAFLLLGRQFIQLMFGDGYQESWTSALLVMTGLLMPLIENSGLAILQAMKKHKFYVIVDLVIAVFNVIGTYMVVDYLGINGAALMTMMTLIIGHIIIINIYYHKTIKLEIGRFFKELSKGIVIAVLIVSVLSFFIIGKLMINSWITFIVVAGGFSLLYFGIMWLMGTNAYERNMIKSYANKLIGKRKISETE